MSNGHTPSDMLTINTRLDYVEKAIEKNEQMIDKRLASMNEFRQALKDQNGTFVVRAEYEAKHLLLDEKIAALEKMVYIGVGAALVIEILIGVLVVFLK